MNKRFYYTYIKIDLSYNSLQIIRHKRQLKKITLPHTTGRTAQKGYIG